MVSSCTASSRSRLCIAGSRLSNRPLRGGAAPVLGGRRLHGCGRTIDRSLGSSVVDAPAVEGCEFGGCLGLRLVLHDRPAGREGVDVGDALAQHRRRNRGAVLRHRGAGLVGKETLRRHGVEHDVGGHIGDPAYVQAGADGVQIGNAGAAGYQDEIGGTGRGKRSIGGMGRRVDHHEADATGAGSTEHATDTRRVGADHHRLIRFP